MECELSDLRLGSDGLVEGVGVAWGDSELRWRWLRIHSSQGNPNPEGKGLRTGCGLEGGEGVLGATVSAGNPSQEAGGAGSPLLPFSRNSERGVIGNVRIGKKSQDLSGSILFSYR